MFFQVNCCGLCLILHHTIPYPQIFVLSITTYSRKQQWQDLNLLLTYEDTQFTCSLFAKILTLPILSDSHKIIYIERSIFFRVDVHSWLKDSSCSQCKKYFYFTVEESTVWTHKKYFYFTMEVSTVWTHKKYFHFKITVEMSTVWTHKKYFYFTMEFSNVWTHKKYFYFTMEVSAIWTPRK